MERVAKFLLLWVLCAKKLGLLIILPMIALGAFGDIGAHGKWYALGASLALPAVLAGLLFVCDQWNHYRMVGDLRKHIIRPRKGA